MSVAHRTQHWKSYLDVVGYEENSRKGDMEKWENKNGNCIIFSSAESEIPDTAVKILLSEMDEDYGKFKKIISVVR